MPELPEVETVRRQLAERLPGRTIDHVEVEDPLLVSPEDAESFAHQVEGQRIDAVGRRGKYLLVELDSGDTLAMHLRMTGRLHWRAGAPPDGAERFLRARFDLDDGSTLTFGDMRRFGRAWIVPATLQDREGYWSARVGIEPLSPRFTGRVLAALLAGRRGPIKAVLLNQALVAGLGNMYVDEALWQARIHPLRPAGSLDADEIRRLHRAIRDRLQAAVDARGASIDSYRDSLGERGTMQDLLRVHLHEGDPCPRCRTTIAQDARRRPRHLLVPATASRSRRRGERGRRASASATGRTGGRHRVHGGAPPAGHGGRGRGARRRAGDPGGRPAGTAGLGRRPSPRCCSAAAPPTASTPPPASCAGARSTAWGTHRRARVPIVPAACIYDLGIAGDGPRPGPDHGYAACEAAAEGPHAVGSVGAGTGATVGKLRGQDGWCKGGLGAASRRLLRRDRRGGAGGRERLGRRARRGRRVLAGAFDPRRGLPRRGPAGARGAARAPAPRGAGSTTLACVVTDAALDKADCSIVARMAQAGVARAVSPADTPLDGDARSAWPRACGRPAPSPAAWRRPRPWRRRSATACAAPSRCAACRPRRSGWRPRPSSIVRDPRPEDPHPHAGHHRPARQLRHRPGRQLRACSRCSC